MKNILNYERLVPAKVEAFGSKTFKIANLNWDCTPFDIPSGSLVAAGQLGWNEQLPLITFAHQLHGFGALRYHLVGSKDCGFASVVTRINFSSKSRCTFNTARS